MTTPTLYIPHGGGPWHWVPRMNDASASLRAYLERLPASLAVTPKAIVCVTAHWEAPVPTVSSHARPPMLYDYYGFPDHTYAIDWPAPGDPALAAKVRALLEGAGIESAEDAERGFDHGTFVPLAVAWPEPTIPTVQLSLVAGLDPATHLAIGRALRPLRDEGVLILGSGMSYHNMRGYGRESGRQDSIQFDTWLSEAVLDPERRETALVDWAKAPAGRASHPREEHLLPLMVVAGAGGDDNASRPFADMVLGAQVSAIQFG